jgi:hypothetical protein
VRNPHVVAAVQHCGLTIRTCLSADPHSQGRVSEQVKIAKVDVVPTDANS